jgi:hypothetical protein
LTARRFPDNLRAAMELADLNQDERTALVGLMKVVVMSDGSVSEDELEHVETLVDAFGESEYQRTLDAFEKRFLDEASFRTFLRGVGREEARELIFGTVLESAGEGALDGGETDLLDWLSKTWNVSIEIADGESP